MTTPPPTPPPSPHRRLVRRWAPTAAAVAIAAILAGIGLGENLYWDDEANTALFARNLIERGALTGWDGVNLAGYRHGAELDENLINVYMPRLQYYAAAVGFLVFGETTVGGRLPFVIAGLLGIVALSFLARHLLGDRLARHLPVLLIAVSPAYLLFIRNCRYYALGALLALALVAAFSSRLTTRRTLNICWVVAILSAAGLMLTNYFNAAGAFAALPVLLLLERTRTRNHLVLLAGIYATAALVAIWVMGTMSPFGSEVIRPDTTPAVERLFTLLRWNLAGLGTFEFVPIALLPALFLPFYVQRLIDLRPLARRMLVLLLAMLVWVVVTVVFSPQSVSGSLVADMRYLVPLIPLGTVATAAALAILWRLLRPLAVAAALLLVFSNIPHLAFCGGENGFIRPHGAQCTLCRYLAEQLTGRTTASEAVIEHLRGVPDDQQLLIVPGFMAYPAMYYLPQKRFCCQLGADHPLGAELRRELPDRLFWERAEPDLALINRPPPQALTGPLMIEGAMLGTYRIIGVIDMPDTDSSRPEIPWHAFSRRDIAESPHFPYLIVRLSR